LPSWYMARLLGAKRVRPRDGFGNTPLVLYESMATRPKEEIPQ